MPPKEKREKRTEVLPPLRVTKGEDVLFKAKALNAGMTLSEFQRQSMIDCVIILHDSEVDKRLTYQLSSLGNNLNQLSKRANIHGELDPIDCDRLNELINDISTVLKERI